MDSSDLERLISRKLAELPRPAASPTLWPRVHATVESHLAQPWYRRAWRRWPAALQAASSGLLAAAVMGSALAAGMAPGLWSRVPGLVQSVGGSVTGAAWPLLSATGVLHRALIEPVAVYLLAFALMTGTAAAALGIVLKQIVTPGGIWES